MDKIFVNPSNNKVRSFMKRHITLGCKVIVIDGSYMTQHRSKDRVSGIQFVNGDQYELLTVTSVNVVKKTDYGVIENILCPHNNCQIKSNDGTVYNCSSINIIKYNDIEED